MLVGVLMVTLEPSQSSFGVRGGEPVYPGLGSLYGLTGVGRLVLEA